MLAAALWMAAAHAGTLTTSTTQVVGDSSSIGNGQTYSGVIYTYLSGAQFHSGSFSQYINNGSSMSDGATTVGTTNVTQDGVADSLWHFYISNQNATYGHTLRFKASETDVTSEMTFTPETLGGLIVEAGENNVKLHGGSTTSERALTITGAASTGVVFTVGANTELSFKSIAFASASNKLQVSTGKALKFTATNSVTFAANSTTTVSAGGTVDFATSPALTGNNSRIVLDASTLSHATLGSGMIVSTTSTGTLDNFTLNGGTIDFGSLSSTSSGLSYTGTLTLTAGDLSISGIDTSLLSSGATYTLLSGTGASGGLTGLTINGLAIGEDGTFTMTADLKRYSGTLAWSDGNLQLQGLTLLSQNLTWGGGTTGTWSTDSSVTGWNVDSATGGGSAFSNDDSVTISGDTSVTLTVNGSVDPAALLVSDNANVTLNAGTDGTITGIGSLTVSGSATLTVNMGNTYSGGTTLNGGTLVLGHADALGTGGITFNGGTLQYGSGITADISGQIQGTGAIKVQTSDSGVTWASDVLSSHAIEKTGAADLTLTLTGGTTYTNALTAGEGNLALNVASGTSTYDGTMSGTGTFVKTGAGTLLLNASATLTGTKIDVQTGTFQMGHGRDTVFSSSPASVSVAGGATFALYGGKVEMDTALTLSHNANLTLVDGAAGTNPSNPNFTITGTVTLGNADAASQDVPDVPIVHIWSKYDKTLKITGQVTGKGQLYFEADRDSTWGRNSFIYLTNENNDFSGGVQINREGGYLQVTNAGALGTGILNLNHASSGFKYEGTAAADGSYDVLKGGTDQIIQGAGSVQILSGHLELQGGNTYGGATTVTAGSLKVSGSIGSNTSGNVYNVAKDASLVVSGTGSVANSGVAVRAKASGTDAVLANATVTTSGIDRTTGTGTEQGKIENAFVSVTQTGAFSLANVNIDNSLVDLSKAGSVSLSNVTFSNGGTLALTLGKETGVTTSTSERLTHTFAGTEQTAGASVSTTLSWTGVEAAQLVLDLNNSLLCSSDLAGKSSVMIWLDGLTLTNASAQLALADHLKNGLKEEGASVSIGSYTGTGSAASGTVVYVNFAPAVMPEPTTATLGLLGLSALLLRRRRRAA